LTWILGIRSFAVEVADWAQDAGLEIDGFLDPSDDVPEGGQLEGLPVRKLVAAAGTEAILATGQTDRRKIVMRALGAGIQLRGLLHPTAHVSRRADIDACAVIGPHATIGAATNIGTHASINRGVLVGHHTRIADLVTLGPGANVAGNVIVEEGALVAMGAVVRDHVRIGAWSRVAMGAVVVADVAAGIEVRGIPARSVPSRNDHEDAGRAGSP
jgi:sugar O-acyltransferase (sialic acid O-acetyltransferase NeuD family)